MALVPCLECKGTIGDTVNICPHCGTDQANFRKVKMGIDSCLECKKEIGLNINICPHCGTNQSSFRNSHNSANSNSFTNNNTHNNSKKYNWWAFFFWNHYYAGYGKFVKAFIMAIIGFVPFTAFFVAMYCGRKANSELPIGKVKFSWGKATLMFLINASISFAIISYVDSKKGQNENEKQQQTLNQEKTSKEQNNDIITQAKEVIQEITDDSEEVKIVKNGKLNAYPNKTIGDAIDSFFGDSSWSSGVSEKGLKFVDVAGKITYMEKPINAKMQFVLDKNGTQFSVRALEFNDIPQNQLMIEGLLEKIYQENTSNNSTNTPNNAQYVDYKENTSTQNLDNNQENKKNLLYFDNISFKGAINKELNIHMTLSIKDDGFSSREIIGVEYYDAYKKNIQIKGDIDDDNNFVFYEVDLNNPDKHTGTFSGTISNLKTISGTWISEDGSKEYPFYITKLQ